MTTPTPAQIRNIYAGIDNVPGLSLDLEGWNSKSAMIEDAIVHLGVEANIIYIDAGHDEDFAFADMQAYWLLLRKGGVMCGDDYSARFLGVVRATGRHSARTKRAVHNHGGHWRMDPK